MQIKFEYYSFLLDEGTIKELTLNLEENSIVLMTYDKSNLAQMSLDEIISQSLIHIPPEIINGIASGLITNIAYDAIKDSIKLILNTIKGKIYTKTYANGTTEEKNADLGIKFKKTNNSFYLNLPSNLSIELQDKCIEKAFELMVTPEKDDNTENLIIMNTMIGKFDSNTQEWETKNICEIINNKYRS